MSDRRTPDRQNGYRAFVSAGVASTATSESVADAIGPLNLAIDHLEQELVGFRRDLHRHPELAWEEHRTTQRVADRLHAAGVSATRLDPTGLIADVGPADAAYRVGLRADLDALALPERTGLPFASAVTGVSHACGHDVHTAALLGAGLALANRQRVLDDLGLAVRLIFQPAEEVMPGGGRMVADSGVLADVDRVFAVHCDPRRDAGTFGLRVGAITGASDAITVRLTGKGGHTSRPHLTADLTYALAKVVTDVPAALSRRIDPRAGAALVWGSIHAGHAPNVIPDVGELQGTLRMLDAQAWVGSETLVRKLIAEVVAPYGAVCEIDYRQGVPPVVNSPNGAAACTWAAAHGIGPESVGPTEQSLGGEDFAWLLQACEGALVRLGTRTPGGRTYDLHQGDLIVDESAVGYGARLLAALPFGALAVRGLPPG